MISIGFYEARTHFSELLNQVAKGKKVLITRRGKPAAVIGPPPAEGSRDVKQVIEEFKAYSKSRGLTPGNLTIRDMIEEGRRF